MVLSVACTASNSPVRVVATAEANVKHLRINKIINVHRPAGHVLGDVMTDKSGTLRLVRTEDADHLAELSRMNQLASIEYDTVTREVSAVGSSPRDFVMSVSPGPASVAVQLMKRPSLLTLDKEHPRFDELLRVIEDAKAARKEISFGLRPGASRIEDVREE